MGWVGRGADEEGARFAKRKTRKTFLSPLPPSSRPCQSDGLGHPFCCMGCGDVCVRGRGREGARTPSKFFSLRRASVLHQYCARTASQHLPSPVRRPHPSTGGRMASDLANAGLTGAGGSWLMFLSWLVCCVCFFFDVKKAEGGRTFLEVRGERARARENENGPVGFFSFTSLSPSIPPASRFLTQLFTPPPPSPPAARPRRHTRPPAGPPRRRPR